MLATSSVPTITSDARPARKRLERLVARRGRKTILLVEDDRDMRSLLATTLRRDGYDVVECANGDDALDWPSSKASSSGCRRRSSPTCACRTSRGSTSSRV